ncbi:MAG: MBL fold metallo-hydrolase [Alphaproteobacteria bacterium]|nr:MBL fold metallo-hydrolase [Alphaproteobacteria bacterium]MBL7098485.1 MBL fold metallo-hydrolase [Alphaproteobacteria bacterium]
MSLDLTILGCGSSGGVPRIGGPDGAGYWGACDPTNPKNRRRRCSIVLRQRSAAGETTLLVDTSPDMKDQLVDARVSRVDAVLLTHDHADQLHGLDDLRQVAMNMRRRVDVHIDAQTMPGVMQRFGYCFVQPEGSDYPPILNAHLIDEPFKQFALGGAGGDIPVLAFGQRHGRIRSLGYRFGRVAYSPDVDGLDDAAFVALEGVDTWIVDALRYTPHPSHSHLARTLEWIARARPRRAILTNMHVDLDYEKLKSELPPGVEPAYDGMTLSA